MGFGFWVLGLGFKGLVKGFGLSVLGLRFGLGFTVQFRVEGIA